MVCGVQVQQEALDFFGISESHMEEYYLVDHKTSKSHMEEFYLVDHKTSKTHMELLPCGP